MKKLFSRIKKPAAEAPKTASGVLLVSSSDVQIGDEISTGPVGTVFKALYRKAKVTAKIFNDPPEAFRKTFESEADVVRKVFHPNIILLMGVLNEPKQCGILMEAMRCDLNSVIYYPEKCPKVLQNLTKLAKFKILRDVAVGLAWIHGVAKIPHGNLKPTNVLFDENGTAKLSDFGFTINSQPVAHSGGYFVQGFGSSSGLYQAPELWSGRSPTTQSDIFSFGLMIIEFLTGNNGFYGDVDPTDSGEIYDAIKRNVQPIVPDDWDATLKAVVSAAVSSDPNKRPVTDEVLAQFDSIVVDSTMTSVSARDFWKTYFKEGEVPLYEVGFDDMMYILSYTSLEGVDDDESEMVAADLRKFFPENGIITATDFDNVALWFGDFFTERPIVDEMRDVANAEWYNGLIDKNVWKGKLSGKVDGVYLIRMSFTDAKKTPFTLTRNAKGSPKHHRIERVSYNPEDPVRFKVKVENKVYQAQTLQDLLDKLTAAHLISTPDDGEATSNYGEA